MLADESELYDSIRACAACSLRPVVGEPVPGRGLLVSKLFIVLEQPDIEAEIEGYPAAGRNEEFLNRLLLQAGISKEEVYTTCAVKCPGEALREHRNACKGWLFKEIDIVRPKVVIAMGTNVTSSLLKKNLSDVKGQFLSVEYTEAKIVPWYSLIHILRGKRVIVTETIDLLTRIKEFFDK